MASTLRLVGIVGAYLTATVICSSVSIAFEWPSPIETPEGPWTWYNEIGMRNGMLVATSHVAPGGRWMLEVHRPQLMPFPFYSWVGPESGGRAIALWFVFGPVAFIHLLRAYAAGQ